MMAVTTTTMMMAMAKFLPEAVSVLKFPFKMSKAGKILRENYNEDVKGFGSQPGLSSRPGSKGQNQEQDEDQNQDQDLDQD